MVALAPNTSEKSTWDVLDGFPKLHSRAREEKTRICTEAPCFKSLSRVEIWQAIYESCVGLESFTRDPIEFEGSEWNLYEFLRSRVMDLTDPTGLDSIDCKCKCGQSADWTRSIECKDMSKIGQNKCCRSACNTTKAFCVFDALPGEKGGLSGTIFVPTLDALDENGRYVCPFPDRCRKRIESLRCHYPEDMPCSKNACRIACGVTLIACQYNADAIPEPRLRRAMKALCSAAALLCGLACETCTDP